MPNRSLSCPDPSHRMLLLLRYAPDGGLTDIEALAMPGWRDDRSTEGLNNPLTPLRVRRSPALDRGMAAAAREAVRTANEVVLLEMPGGELVLRYDALPSVDP